MSPIVVVAAVNTFTPLFGISLCLSNTIGTAVGTTWNWTWNALAITPKAEWWVPSSRPVFPAARRFRTSQWTTDRWL